MRILVSAVTGIRTIPAITAQAVGPIFALLLVAAATPVMMTDLAPLVDYANHLGRMQVIASIARDPDLARLYALEWAPIPNLIMDLVVPPLCRFLDVYQAGQVFLMMVLALLVSGPLAIQRALFGRVSMWPLVAFPFVYNAVFLTGLVNYLFGVGVAMWALAGWIALRSGPAWRRTSLSAICVMVLYVCHLFALGIYGLGILGYEAWRTFEGDFDWRRLFKDALIGGLPFLAVLPLLASSPTIGLSGENLWESGGKFEGLTTIFTTYGDIVDMPIAALTTALLSLSLRRRLLTFHPSIWFVLAAGAAIYLAMPRMLFGSWFADYRLPVAVFFLVIGFIRFDERDLPMVVVFLAMVTGLSAARFIDIEANWMALRAPADDMRSISHLIDRGAPVLVAHADQPTGSQAQIEALTHAACVTMIERSALVSTAFSVHGKQILDVRPGYRDLVDPVDGDPPTVSQLLATTDDPVPGETHYWDKWPTRYRYVFILYTDRNPNPDPDHLTLLHEGPYYQLYSVRTGDDETEEVADRLEP